MPILKNSNCDSKCSGYYADLTYCRKLPSRTFNTDDLVCGSCKKRGKPEILSLPQEFYLRLAQPKTVSFDDVILPSFDTHKPKSYLQFCKKLDHFRTVCFSNKHIVIRDGNK